MASPIERMHSHAWVLGHSANLTHYTVSRNLNPISTGDFRGIGIARLYSLLGRRAARPFWWLWGRGLPPRTSDRLLSRLRGGKPCAGLLTLKKKSQGTLGMEVRAPSF